MFVKIRSVKIRSVKIINLLWLGVLMLGCFNPLAAWAKSTAPVAIEYSAPETVQKDAVISTVIRFIAQRDLERLEVSVAPYEGLTLVSNEAAAFFQALKKGEVREFGIKIQMTNPEVGYLSVFATTTTSMQARTKAIAIRYGTAGPVASLKLKSKSLMQTPEGENLILLQGDPR